MVYEYDKQTLDTVAMNVAWDILDMGETQALNNIEVNWLDGSNCYCVNIGDELIRECGSEKEAEWFKDKIESEALDWVTKLVNE